jgi:cephalosporin-C deacetylase-like acetyl esterase
MNPYDYERGISGLTERLQEESREFSHYSIQFQSALDTGYKENSLVKGEYYAPKNKGKAPLVIIVHGMGDQSMIPCKMMARSLLKQGIASFLPYLTIHSKRLPRALRANYPFLTPDEWFQTYRVSVVDIRQIIDWASSKEEVDSERIAVTGISFGGFVSAIAMGIEPRIKSGVFIVTGGNSNKMSWLSASSQYRKRYPRSLAEHSAVQENFRLYLRAVAERGFENINTDDNSFLTDPLTFAGTLRKKPVLMINALYDKYIPKEAATELWEACGRQPIKWVSSGHVTLWLRYPSIKKAVEEFLMKSFKGSRIE